MPVYPIILPENFKSSDAERAILDRFLRSKYADDKSVYVFHSIRAQEIGRKVVGEIDFIYLDEECILFLEVKGGKVYFSEATRDWWVMNGNKKQDPWKQVADYLFHVRDKMLPIRFPDDFFSQKLIFGYGVIFPDCKKPETFLSSYSKRKNTNSYEYELGLVYDAIDHNQRDDSIEKYISRIKKYWKAHGSNKGHKGVNSNDLTRIKNYFSQDIIFETPVSEVLVADARSTNHLTVEQGRALNFCINNLEHAFVVKGGPGTGKTVLAFDLACKYLRLGEMVLFIVYNQPLRDFLLMEKERLLKQRKITQKEYDCFKIENYSRLMTSFLKSIDSNFEILDRSSFWHSLPNLFIEKSKGEKITQFDRLIVDECQDIANKESFDVLSRFLIGGLNSKRFTFFIDERFQVLYSKRFNKEFFHSFVNQSSALSLHLNRNCRNSINIVEEASINTGLPTMECMKGKMFEPELNFYLNHQEMITILKRILINIKKAQVGNKLIGIITDNIQDRDLILNEVDNSSKLSTNYFLNNIGSISCDTGKRYKGLDNELIIYVGSKFHNDQEEFLCNLYVSITRAKGRLYLLFPSSCENELDKFRNVNGIKIFKKEL